MRRLLTGARTYLSFDVVELVFELLPAGLCGGDGALESRRPYPGALPHIVGHFFHCPPRLVCPLGEVVPQVIESDLRNHSPLARCGLGLERAEPVVDALFGQALAALREKHIGARGVNSGLQVVIERLAGLLQQIDLPRFAPLIAHLEPSLLWTHVGIGHLQPGELADPAAGPVAQREESSPASILILIDQRTQDGALLMREQWRSEQRHRRKLDAACRVALEQPFLLDQKIGKGADARFHARAVVETESLLL